MRFACWLVAGLIAVAPALACPPDTIAADSVAVRYLDAIDNMDWAKMESLLADDARYTDPTMVHFDRPAIDLTGPAEIVGFWRASSEDSGTSDIAYTRTGCFETAGYHVVNLDIAITVSGAFWNVNRDNITIPGKVLSIIRTRGGKVTEHHDYVGYAGGDRHVEMLQQQFGRADD